MAPTASAAPSVSSQPSVSSPPTGEATTEPPTGLPRFCRPWCKMVSSIIPFKDSDPNAKQLCNWTLSCSGCRECYTVEEEEESSRRRTRFLRHI
eukprot:11180661-Ditylum_brightwellii.AAC.1